MDNKPFDEKIYENLPDILKRVTAGFMEREKDIVLLSSIGVLSSSLPNVFGTYDGKLISANIYIMIIAPPASGKGVMNYSRLLVEPIHAKVLEESLGNYEDCKNSQDKKKRKNLEACPPIVTKIIPGNISSAEIYSVIKNAHYGGVMVESETDTISIMLNQDWGNFSDVLRKAFHHETISISRKTDKLHMEIARPELSLVLSGTPDQLQPLIKSKDNGLFSRMIYYYFDEDSEWKNVFKDQSRQNQSEFEKAGKEIFTQYGILADRKEPIEFSLTREQRRIFNEEMGSIMRIVNDEYSRGFSSNVRRHGLILFRLCMIFSVFRLGEENCKTVKTIQCRDDDFENALLLTKILLRHASVVYDNVATEGLSEVDDQLLFNLQTNFTRKQALEIAKDLDISERSLDERLVRWRKEKIISKVSHGNYKRIKN